MKVGEILINSIKPVYVYEENNCLFIKNINEKIEKIANNIVSYCAILMIKILFIFVPLIQKVN